MPKVSIIVPVYNVENWLKRCVDSIINQIFTDFELILVDDGSTDNSGKICDEYLKKDYRIKVVHKENGGVSSARNMGIDLAIGEYIMFVDSDDYIEKRMLESMLYKVGYEVDLIISTVKMVCADKTYENPSPSGTYTVKDIFDIHYKTKNPILNIGAPYGKLYKSSIIKSNSIKFKNHLSLGEDGIFNIEYIDCCKDIVLINECYYNYMLENVDSLFSKFQKNTYEQLNELFLYNIAILEKVGCEQNIVLNAKIYHIERMMTYLITATKKATYSEYLHYSICVSDDKTLVENINELTNMRIRIIARLILKKQYRLVYFICKVWNSLIHIN